MRPLTALRKGFFASSIGATHDDGPSWNNPFAGFSSMLGSKEGIGNDYASFASAFSSNGPLFTTILVRMSLFSEVRFQWQRFEGGRPGKLYGNERLQLLERPGRNQTTGEMLSRMEQHVSLAGNSFTTIVDSRIRHLRPDCMTVVSGSESGSPWALDAKVIGYMYTPPDSSPATLLTPEQVCHWSPIPDPQAQWRGMSWITAILREVEGDRAATRHKLKFFENGASSNMVVVHDKGMSAERVAAFKALFDESHKGVDKAYKTIHLGGGADVKMIGADLKQLEFKLTQGAGESRIAAASMVGAVMAQFSEGMAGSSLNAGNFQAARRRLADIWARPQWRSVAAALETLVPPAPGERLWYDARDVSFLQEDEKDAAAIFQIEAGAAQQLITAGYTPESVAVAVAARNVALLAHTGAFSVQLQPPSTGAAAIDGKAFSISVPAKDVPSLLAEGWTIASKEPAA